VDNSVKIIYYYFKSIILLNINNLKYHGGNIMNMREIVKDALLYPFSDWKKILILGIIVLFSNTIRLNPLFGSTITVMLILGIIGFLISFLARGYQFRIIKSSLSDNSKLPDFNQFKEMFVDGIRVFLVSTVYLLPAILIIVLVTVSFNEIIGIVIPNLSSVVAGTILSGKFTAMISSGTWAESWFLIAFIYMIFILPVSLLAIAIMAENQGKLSSAFKPGNLLDKIKTLGLINILKWYLVTGILFLIFYIIGGILTSILVLLQPIIGITFQLLIVIPYLYMFLYRSVGLFYISTEDNKSE
jgi:hypothetical protein